MRRFMLLLIAVGSLGSLVGCNSCGRGGCSGLGGGSGSHSVMHGICDCELDNHCRDRSPWVQMGVPVTQASEAVPAPPMKLPDGKKGL